MKPRSLLPRVQHCVDAEGHGIDSQDTLCREFARAKGYTVARVFKDEAVSGRSDRSPRHPGNAVLPAPWRQAPRYVVLIDDMSRHNIKAHIELRGAIASTGALLESPSIEFGEDSAAQLVEHLLASVSQYQREKKAEQTRRRMASHVVGLLALRDTHHLPVPQKCRCQGAGAARADGVGG